MNDFQLTSVVLTRRRLLTLAGAAIAGGVLAGCGGADGDDTSSEPGTDGGEGATAGTIKIGYVTPRTGTLADFGKADAFVLDEMRAFFADGLTIAGATYAIEIIDRDSESNSTTAANVAQDLISGEEIDLMLVSSTPDTTVPVVQQCTNNEIPVLSNNAPWQPHYLSIGGELGGDAPPVASPWNYHFFWGLEDIIETYTAMWSEIAPGATVGALWPDDPDGNAWSDAATGFPPALEQLGFDLVDPGRFDLGAQDFTSQISAFKDAGVEIVTGVVPPPVFGNFWAQAQQQGFTPKVVTVAKATEFPSAIESFENPLGLSVEIWWSDRHPTTSSLTGQSSAELAEAWEATTGEQWTQPLGYSHSLFEVAIDAITRAGGAGDKQALLDAFAETNLATMVGQVDFTDPVVPQVTKTPLVAGQWVEGADWPYELEMRTTDQFAEIDVDGPMVPIEL
ncbi:MAG: ABC transporter substrate-binding protein [Actinomycetota bacterium]